VPYGRSRACGSRAALSALRQRDDGAGRSMGAAAASD